MAYYDRYQNFRSNSKIKIMPGLVIPIASTDKTVIYKVGKTRLDILSNTYYNSPYFSWLILSANQQYGGLEFLIPDQSPLIIPFPLESALSRYTTQVNNYNTLYGA